MTAPDDEWGGAGRPRALWSVVLLALLVVGFAGPCIVGWYVIIGWLAGLVWRHWP